ncbi:TSUP family transporter [Rhodopirellula sp. JC740]|uniref:Probable membrane transporter protein n=1 Tax=Rhodopirellula halodulae TaxID=2894198 RepID=A0ABS8NIV6_9BACT|nr:MULTISPECIES: TSUP family transporter [unclassified Rhodopirellula]MCC9643489.1 TSUP family transporter [Rhodopirellula sp. JC740]MCC9658119.1 TSUP family transporter [Rhodopirellula sp. JC737]
MDFAEVVSDPDTWKLVAVLSLGIFVQAAAGFAAGLLIVPLLLWAGYTIPEAQTSLLVATVPQNIWGVISFRDSLEGKRLIAPGAARLLFLPVGVLTLQWMESFSVMTLRQVVGAAVLLATIANLFFRPTPRKSVAAFWGFLAFPLSGFMQGLVGMGGPPMVLWVQAHDWDTRRSRGFLFSMYLISLAPGIAVLVWFFGARVIPPALIAGAAIPILLVVTWAGLRVGTALGTERLRRVTMALLLLMGLAGLAAPWLTPPT